MQSFIRKYLILVSLSLFFTGCSKDSGNPSENIPADESKKYSRDFDFDSEKIFAQNLDTNDFKKVYSELEIKRILADSSNKTKHHSVIMDDDLIYANIYSLVHSSYDIIAGNVEKVEPKWDSDHRMIYTFKTINIENTFKKKANLNKIIISDIGGELDGFKTTYADYVGSLYPQGKNVLCFINIDVSVNGDTTYSTYGMSQGIFIKTPSAGI